MKHLLLACAFMVMTFLAAGCQTAGEASGKASDLLVAPLDAGRIGYSTAWLTTLDVPERTRIVHAAVLDDVIVTVEMPGNLVSCISVRDGSFKWRKAVGTSTLYKPFRVKDQICINTESRLFVLNIETGAFARVNNLEFVVNSEPAVFDHFAVYGSMSGRVFCHDIVAGYSLWTYQMPGGVSTAPVVSGSTDVLISDDAGNYRLFSNNKGELKWIGRAFGKISAQPAINNFGIYIPSLDQSLYSVDRATGRDRRGWPYRSAQPLTESPLVLGSALFLNFPNGDLISLDPLNGTELWRIPGGVRPVALNDQKLLLLSSRSIMQVDNNSGKLMTQVPISPLQTILRAPNNTLYLVTSRGKIQRLDPQ